jgi:hypothetical protein
MRTRYLLASFLFVACGKSDKKPAEQRTSTADKPITLDTSAKPTDGPNFAAWDMQKRTAAWQGAFAGDGESLGDTAAWEVKGSDVTFVNKRGEKKLKLEIESPCTAKFVESKDGSTSSSTAAYTLEGDELITGLGDAGSKKGDTAIVCGGGAIFDFDGKTCKVWQNHFDRWQSEPGDCGFAKGDKGEDIFRYKLHDYETKLIVDGDVIWSEQLSRVHAKKLPDLAAAKAEQKL